MGASSKADHFWSALLIPLYLMVRRGDFNLDLNPQRYRHAMYDREISNVRSLLVTTVLARFRQVILVEEENRGCLVWLETLHTIQHDTR